MDMLGIDRGQYPHMLETARTKYVDLAARYQVS
jgi:hypothetical protein